MQEETSFECKVPAIPKKDKKKYTFKFDTLNPFDIEGVVNMDIKLIENCANSTGQLQTDLQLKFNYEYEVKVHTLID